MRNIVTILLSIVCILTISFKPSSKELPPGTVQFKDNLFVDKTEVTNLNWKEFIFWLKQKFGEDSEQYKANLPDQSVWGENMAPFAKHYFNHIAYNEYPVVGISYEQAVNYCKWRSKQVNTYLFIKSNKNIKWNADSSYDDAPQIYNYRLPTKKEFEEIAKIGYKPTILKKIKKKGLTKFNCIENNRISETNDSITAITAPVDSYFPNEIGVFNIFGNVSEMVEEKGIAKGGSWSNSIIDLVASKDFSYSKPENWLGFRCVCERKL